MTTNRTSLNLSPEAAEFIRREADARGISMGEVVRRALNLEKYLKEQMAQGNTVLIETRDKKLRELVTL